MFGVFVYSVKKKGRKIDFPLLVRNWWAVETTKTMKIFIWWKKIEIIKDKMKHVTKERKSKKHPFEANIALNNYKR